MARPRNLISNKPYHGINLFLLCGKPFKSNYWLTYPQAEQVGGHVKKGEKSTIVVYWKMLEVDKTDDGGARVFDPETGDAKKKKIPLLRFYRVFNLEQTEGCDHKRIREAQNAFADRETQNPTFLAEQIIARMPNPPAIVIDDAPAAFYSPMEDKVHMLRREQCISDEAYYETFLHELVHSTGHVSRLNRKADHDSYAMEELTAEMGSAFLCADCGIFQQQLDNSAAYIAGWLKALKNDRTLVVHAAAKASKAAEYILNEKEEPQAEPMAMAA